MKFKQFYMVFLLFGYFFCIFRKEANDLWAGPIRIH